MGIKLRRHLLTIAVIAVALLILIYLSVSIVIPKAAPLDVVKAIFGVGTEYNNRLVWTYAMPRVTMACFVGAGLAIAGAVMQALFRNPMASPYILGLSSGASLGASVGMLFAIPLIPTYFVAPVLAFVCCLGTMLLVYRISYVAGRVPTETLLLSGIAVSSLLSALVSLLTYFAGDRLSDLVFWSMGSLSQYGWTNTCIAVPLIILSSVLMMFYSRELNAMMVGDAHAMDLGVDVGRVRLILLVLASLGTAACVSFVGVIGFVGLVIPHIMRLLIGPDNRRLLPYSMFAGAAFLMACDYISRVVLTDAALPVGIVTSLIGAPYFIYLLRRRKKEVGWN